MPVLELIKLEIAKIADDRLDAMRSAMGQDLLACARNNRADYEKALMDAIEIASKRVRSELVLPFVARTKTPLERLDLGDENTLYLIEEELCELLLEPARNKISELIRRIIEACRRYSDSPEQD